MDPDDSAERKPDVRVYEVMFIVRPDGGRRDIDKLIAGFSTNVNQMVAEW